MVKESGLEGIERRKRFIELLIIVAGLVLSYDVSLPVKDDFSFLIFLIFMTLSIGLFHSVCDETIGKFDKLLVNCVAILVSLTFALYMILVFINGGGSLLADFMFLDGNLSWSLFCHSLVISVGILSMTYVVFVPLCIW